MKIIKIYTIRAAHKLLLSVEVIPRYSPVWPGPGWDLTGGTKHSLMKNAPWAGEKLLQDSNTQSSNTALRNRPGYIFHEIFSGLSIFEGTEPLLVI